MNKDYSKKNNIRRDILFKMGLSDPVIDLGEKVLEEIKDRFEEIDAIAEYNQAKVLQAMQAKGHKVDLLGLQGKESAGKTKFATNYIIDNVVHSTLTIARN